jgi:hypothetical protein
MLVIYRPVKMEQLVYSVLKIVQIKTVNMVHYLPVIVPAALPEQLVKRLLCLNHVLNHVVDRTNVLNEVVYFIVYKQSISFFSYIKFK